jgi:hypothetical protein
MDVSGRIRSARRSVLERWVWRVARVVQSKKVEEKASGKRPALSSAGASGSGLHKSGGLSRIVEGQPSSSTRKLSLTTEVRPWPPATAVHSWCDAHRQSDIRSCLLHVLNEASGVGLLASSSRTRGTVETARTPWTSFRRRQLARKKVCHTCQPILSSHRIVAGVLGASEGRYSEPTPSCCSAVS